MAALWLTATGLAAQTSSFERIRGQRLSGDVISRISGLSWEQCEDRCLANRRCVAIEHFRGEGRVVSSQPLCRLFSRAGERRDSRFADIGMRRPGAGPRVDSVARKRDEVEREAKKRGKKAAEAGETAAAATPGAAPPPAAPSGPVAKSEPRPDGARPHWHRLPAPPPTAGSPPPPPPVAAAPAPPPPTPAPSAAPPAPSAAPPVTGGRPYAPAPSLPRSAEPPPASPPSPGPSASAPPRPEPPRAELPRTRGLTPAPGAPPLPAPAPATAPPAPAAPARAPPTPAQPADWDVVPVYYGTDRARRDTAKRIGYGTERARRMELGRALVTVPKLHQVPAIERPWALKVPWLDITIYEEAEDPKKHFTVQEIRSLTREQAVALVRERLAASRAYPGHALVFVHGYNNGFDDALYRTAQIAYDLKFDGAPFLYSWPSGGGTLSYPLDRESAQQAEQYLSQFLQLVLNETGAKSVSIIAHSMGNQPLLQVLRDLKRNAPPGAPRLDQVILAAPDVDRDAFEFLSSQIEGVSRGITMYASSNDRALVVSRRFAGGVPRAGDVPADLGPAVMRGVDTIDISALSTEYLSLNHSAYAEKSALLQDIELMLRTGERPPERRLPILVRVESERGAFWRYPR